MLANSRFYQNNRTCLNKVYFVLAIFLYLTSVDGDQPESYSYESADYSSSYEENPVCVDEEYNKTCCHNDEFQCGNGACITLDKVCQNNLNLISPIFRYHRLYRTNVDCSDYSDEMGCSSSPCSTRTLKCPQLCLDLPGNKSRCTCYKGYTLISRTFNTTCEDIDECLISVHTCSHDCINKNGTYSCGCKEGYKLGNTSSNTTCHIQDQHAVILYNSGEIIKSFNISSGKVKDVVKSGVIDNFDYDIANTIMYWSTKSNNDLAGVFRSYIPGAKNGSVTVGLPQHIGESLSEIVRGSLAIDWTAGDKYWLAENIFNSTKAQVMVSKLDGRYSKTLIEIEHGTGLVLDPEAGRMYYSAGGEGPHIGSAFMNGMIRMILIRLDNQNPTALALDHMSLGRLYWVDSLNSTIYYVHVNSRRVTKVYTTTPERTPISMDIFENNIYWITRDSKEILTMNKFGKGAHAKLLVMDREMGSFLKIYHDLKITVNIRQNSLYCKSQCSHLCLHIPRGYACTCPDGSQLITKDGEVVCDSEQLDPLEDPIACNCNDKDMPQYNQCPCPSDSDSGPDVEQEFFYSLFPSIKIWLSTTILIAFAVIAVLFITGVILSFYGRGTTP